MRLGQLSDTVLGWLRRAPRTARPTAARGRGPLCHVIILDGTMSSLREGAETNAGLAFKLLQEVGLPLSVYYEAGIQWRDWRGTPDVMLGRGINRQIRRAYGYLASRYRPGDKIYLIGYSRGAYAVRSLAGVIGQLGLLRDEHATVRNVRQAYRHYQFEPASPVARAFAAAYCHEKVEIEAMGLWDTVKALDVRFPLIWRLLRERHGFHNHELHPCVKRGYHALALHETRLVYTPVLWKCLPGLEAEWAGRVQQVWFRGTHGDVGGQVVHCPEARPLANIPLVWLMEQMEACGLKLPRGWHARFPCDPAAPSCGTWAGWAKLFVLRGRRVVGTDPSERIHETAQERPGGEALPVALGARTESAAGGGAASGGDI